MALLGHKLASARDGCEQVSLIRRIVAIGTEKAKTKVDYIPGDHYSQKPQLIHQCEVKERISTEKDSNGSSCYLLFSQTRTSAYKKHVLQKNMGGLLQVTTTGLQVDVQIGEMFA